MAAKEIKNVVEALLFSSNSPVSIETIKDTIEDTDAKTISDAILELKTEYDAQDRAFTINEIAGGFQLTTKPQYSNWIKKMFNAPKQDRLSKPSLETLAIIAYKQPVSRPDIEGIRGVNVDGVLRTLLDKRFIRVLGRKETIGRPMIYGTTKEFLEYFGLSSLTQLPPLEEFVDTQMNTDEKLIQMNTDEEKKNEIAEVEKTD